MQLTTDQTLKVMNVITRISQGYTLTAACDAERLTYDTFRKLVNAIPELAAMFTDAEQRGYDVMADALVNIFNHELYGETDPKKAKIISDNIKWLLARRRSTVYGDRSVVEHQFTADRTIVEALQRGKENAAKAVIDAVEYTVVEEAAPLLPPELMQFA